MSKRNTRLQVSLSLFTLALASPALAQTYAAGSATLPVIVTGASKVPLEAARVGASVSVVTAEQIAERKIQTLTEALATVPGIQMDSNGGRGNLTAFRIRGAESRHALVVIDGIPVNSVTSGGFNFADLLVEDIERIEVIKGPQSAIYGPEANSGVIAITTKSGRGRKPEITARTEYGSFDSAFGALSIRGQQGLFYGSASATGYTTGGSNISRFGSERDGSNAQQFGFRMGMDPSENVNIEAGLLYIQRRTNFETGTVTDPSSRLLVPTDDPASYSNYRRVTGRLGGSVILLDGRWKHKLGGNFMEEQDVSITPSVATSNGARQMLDYSNALNFDTGPVKNTLVTGFDTRWETYSTQQAFANRRGPFTRGQTGIFGEWIAELPTDTTLSGTLRHDWNDSFANSITWRAALSQRIAMTGSRIHASIGRGVTNPGFTQQFGVFSSLAIPFVGNPELQQESSIGYDIGFEQGFWNNRLVADVTFFHTDFTNRITQVTRNGANTLINDPANSTRDGVEVSARATVTDWLSLNASYTYTNAQSPTQLAEVRRPVHTAAGSILLSFPDYRTKANLTLRQTGDFVDTASTPSFASVRVNMPAITLLSASITYDVTRYGSVYLRGDNLLNTQYETIYGYRAPGASVFAGLTVKFSE